MSAVAPPNLALESDDLVDWLELNALFDPFGVARVDALAGALAGLEESAEDDIGERDRQREQLLERLENEIGTRLQHLDGAYPFRLSDSGEELIREDNWREAKFSFYLVCLVATHVTESSILVHPPVGSLRTQLRNRVFQIVATLGLAGFSSGPAFSVGWPRHSGETIVELLTRASALGGGFTARNPPGPYTSPHEKDGGVDVIAWTAGGLPPPAAFFFGQTASGKNWPGKPVTDHARVFGMAYMQDHMTGNLNHVTMIPYRILDEKFLQAQNLHHKGILERLRLPLNAWRGLELAGTGIHVDEAQNVGDLVQWLGNFIEYANAA